MKKFLALLLSLTLVFTLAACGGDDDPDDTGNGGGDFDFDLEESETLTIGTVEFSGEFIFFGGSSSYDVAIRESINGAGLVSTDKGGKFLLNENVLTADGYTYLQETVLPAQWSPDSDTAYADLSDEMKAIFDEDGNKTYEFEIRDDMLWSDGEPITAQDYAFGVKMGSAYAIAQAGHTAPQAGNDLVGYDDWRQGCYGEFDSEGAWVCDDPDSTEVDFDGINVVDDQTIQFTVNGDNLPYFYELAMVGMGPQPEHVYTDGGTYDFLTRAEFEALGDDDTHIGEYISSMISSPPVSSGPYVLDHYERDQFVRLSLNENYVGDYRGHTPSIQNVIVRVVPTATDIEHLLNEEIDILTGLVEGEKITRALDADHLYDINYKRIGFGGLFMQVDLGAAQDYRVRQAVAHMIDRDEFVNIFLEGYGEVVNAPYGLGQWMVSESDIVPDELTHYDFDLTKANDLLDAAGWDKDENGDDWVDFETSGTRYNDAGEELVLGWMGTESDYSDILAVYLTPSMEEAGVNFSTRQAGFGVLIDNYYYAYQLPDEEREYHMYNLATSFTALYDPYYSYHSDMLNSTYNTHQLKDTPDDPQVDDFSEQEGHGFSWMADGGTGMTVDEFTTEMRTLPPSETEQFEEYWSGLMLRMNKLMPVVPLYSNQYYHFANERVEGFELTGFWNWQQNIVDMELVD